MQTLTSFFEQPLHRYFPKKKFLKVFSKRVTKATFLEEARLLKSENFIVGKKLHFFGTFFACDCCSKKHFVVFLFYILVIILNQVLVHDATPVGLKRLKNGGFFFNGNDCSSTFFYFPVDSTFSSLLV